MNNLNPLGNIAKSEGVDLPVITVYLAGRISGEHIEKCLAWRRGIINHYKNYKGKGAYPIAFLSPLNSGEADSVDKKGLTSNIPPNLIYDKDLLSVQHSDVIVANMEDFFEEDLSIQPEFKNLQEAINGYNNLIFKILNRRENIGTIMEVAWGLYLQKPVILIVPKRRKETFQKHPFTRRASVIVTSVEELLKDKWLQIIYKSMAGSIKD